MRARVAFALVVVAGWFTAAGCSYNPKFKDGELKCSIAGECPDGYMCRANACFSSGGGGDAGVDDAGPSQDLLNRYIGNWTWAMDLTAAVTNHCDDGTSYSNSLTAESDVIVTAGPGGEANLQADWLCIANLHLDAAGAHLVAPSTNCKNVTSGDPTRTWTVTKFELVGLTSKALTHTATYTRVDHFASSKVVTCAQTVAGTLTPSPN